MKATADRTELADAPATATDDDIVHITCCEDEDVALCGADMSQVEWWTGVEPNECPPCRETYTAALPGCVDLCPVQVLRDLA